MTILYQQLSTHPPISENSSVASPPAASVKLSAEPYKVSEYIVKHQRVLKMQKESNLCIILMV